MKLSAQILSRAVAGLLLLACIAHGGAAQAQSCTEDFQKLTERRMAQIQALNALGKAGKGKMDPTAACAVSKKLVGVEGEMAGYMTKNKEMLNDYPPYGQAAVPASCLRNHLMLKEMKEGRGPIWMDTVTALGKLRETLAWLQIDPAGVIYNSVTRQPVSGAVVTFLFNGSLVSNSWLDQTLGGANTYNLLLNGEVLQGGGGKLTPAPARAT